MNMYKKIRKPIGFWPSAIVLLIALGMLVMIILGVVAPEQPSDINYKVTHPSAKTPVSNTTQPVTHK